MNDTIPTHEMIQNLAEYIVNGMSYAELTQHVYNDIYYHARRSRCISCQSGKSRYETRRF